MGSKYLGRNMFHRKHLSSKEGCGFLGEEKRLPRGYESGGQKMARLVEPQDAEMEKGA